MVEVIELFDDVVNVEFKELKYVEEVKTELPVFTLADIPVDRWNTTAKKANTKAFIDAHERRPKDYGEVLTWI